MSEIDLTTLQIGKQTVWETPVAATAKLGSVTEAEIDSGVTGKVLRSRRGNLTTGYNAALLAKRPKMTLRGWASYEELNYWLEGMVGEVTPAGAGPYTRDGAAPGASQVVPRRHTVYYGDTAGGVYRLVGGVPISLKLSGNSNEEATYEVELLGYDVESGATLAGLSDPALNPLIGNDFAGGLFVDLWGGTIGTTAVANTFYSFALELNANRGWRKRLGNLRAGGFTGPGWTGKLSLHAEFDATSKAWLDAILAASGVFQRQVRLKAAQGANLAVQLDFAGTQESAPKLWPEDDGMQAVDIELADTYNAALGNWFKYQTKSNVAALP